MWNHSFKKLTNTAIAGSGHISLQNSNFSSINIIEKSLFEFYQEVVAEFKDCIFTDISAYRLIHMDLSSVESGFGFLMNTSTISNINYTSQDGLLSFK